MTDVVEVSPGTAFRVVEGWGELADGSLPVGDVGDIGIDSQDRVFVLNRGPSPVTIFDPDGTVLEWWGEGQFTRPHGLFIGNDDFDLVFFFVEDHLGNFRWRQAVNDNRRRIR